MRPYIYTTEFQNNITDLDYVGIPTHEDCQAPRTCSFALSEDQREDLWVQRFYSYVGDYDIATSVQVKILKQIPEYSHNYTPELRDELLEVVLEDSGEIQEAAAYALSHVYSEDHGYWGIKTLLSHFSNMDEATQVLVAKQFRSIANVFYNKSRMHGRILDLMQQGCKSEKVKLSLADTLVYAKCKDDRLALELRYLSSSENPKIVLSTIELMGDMRPNNDMLAVTIYHKLGSDDLSLEMQEACLQAMTKMGQPAISLLAKFATDPKQVAEIRAKAVMALANMRYKFDLSNETDAYHFGKIQDAVLACMKDSKICVRDAAYKADILLREYKQSENDPQFAQAETFANTDEKSKAAEAKMLYEALYDQDADVVLSAIKSIGRDHLDVPKLKESLRLIAKNSDNPLWRQAAFESLYGEQSRQASEFVCS